MGPAPLCFFWGALVSSGRPDDRAVIGGELHGVRRAHVSQPQRERETKTTGNSGLC